MTNKTIIAFLPRGENALFEKSEKQKSENRTHIVINVTEKHKEQAQ